MEGTKKEVTHYANAAGGLGNMKMELGEHEPLKGTGDLNKSHSDALVWAEAKGSGESNWRLQTCMHRSFQETLGFIFLTECKSGTAWPSQPRSIGSHLWLGSDASFFLMNKAVGRTRPGKDGIALGEERKTA